MTTLADLPIRDELRGLSPYGAPQKQVRYPLNVNENPHPVPENVANDIASALSASVGITNRYPDREFTELREHLADYLGHNLSRENIWAANGSNEVIQQLLQVFAGPGRSVLGFDPSYSMHSLITRSVGARWVGVERDPQYQISPETAVRAIREHRPDLVFFCSPNNPTGTPVLLETIEAAYLASEGIVFVDEAYAEFASPKFPSALSLLPGRERLVVSRTMSKAFAFAGVRLGYLAADPAISDAIRLVRLPYHLSVLTQTAAVIALKHAPVMLAQVSDIVVQRKKIAAELPRLGYRAYPSEANFVLFGGVADPPATFTALLAHDILVRDVGIPNTLRVTAGTGEETDYFLATLGQLRLQDE